MDFPGEKLVTKLWETLAEKGLGSLLKPWQDVREGRARNEVRRDELLMLAQAEIDAVEIRAGRKRLRADGTLVTLTNFELDSSETNAQIGNRIDPILALPASIQAAAASSAAINTRSEINSTKAILYAEEQLASDPQAPPERDIEEDWLFAWRDYAGRVSAEDLQRLWGSVLAGEIKSPGKYSLRTLEFLKVLSKTESDVICKLARFSIGGYVVNGQEKYLADQGLPFGQLLNMQNLGVISSVDAHYLTVKYATAVEGKFTISLVSNSKALVVEHEDAAKVLELKVFAFTDIGNQILDLGSFEPDLVYLRLIGKQIAGQGFKVELCDWVRVSDDERHYFNAVSISS